MRAFTENRVRAPLRIQLLSMQSSLIILLFISARGERGGRLLFFLWGRPGGGIKSEVYFLSSCSRGG